MLSKGFEKFTRIFYVFQSIFSKKNTLKICQGRWKIDYKKSNIKVDFANRDN